MRVAGALADQSTSRFGRRRPYIMLGSLICGAAMVLLGFTRYFAGWFTAIPSPSVCVSFCIRRKSLNDDLQNDTLTVALAIWAIYCIDFSVNAGMSTVIWQCVEANRSWTVMAADRALIVDVWPESEQQRGNAWAARMAGVGAVMGFFMQVTPAV